PDYAFFGPFFLDPLHQIHEVEDELQRMSFCVIDQLVGEVRPSTGAVAEDRLGAYRGEAPWLRRAAQPVPHRVDAAAQRRAAVPRPSPRGPLVDRPLAFNARQVER